MITIKQADVNEAEIHIYTQIMVEKLCEQKNNQQLHIFENPFPVGSEAFKPVLKGTLPFITFFAKVHKANAVCSMTSSLGIQP